MKKSIIPGVVLVCLFGWVLLSWVDVVAHNLDTAPAYAAWNLFAMII